MMIKDNANIVIVGAWNLGILNPAWFAKEFPELKLGKEAPVEIQLNTGSLRFNAQKIKINPNPDKLIFFSDIDDNENYKFMSEIATETIKKLRYTPITAVGHNISYYVDDFFELFENNKLDEYKKFYQETTNTIALNSQEVKHALAYENYILNLTYNINRQRNYINFNYYYEANTIEKIEACLKDFKKNIENSKMIYSKLVRKK